MLKYHGYCQEHDIPCVTLNSVQHMQCLPTLLKLDSLGVCDNHSNTDTRRTHQHGSFKHRSVCRMFPSKALANTPCQKIQHALQATFAPDKVNVASIGNMVPELHVHVTCRRRGDVSWPGPCYGAAPQVPFSEEQLPETVARLRRALPPPTLLKRLMW
jgi:hypothetical protein